MSRFDKVPTDSQSRIMRGSGKAPLLAHFAHRGPKHYDFKKGDGDHDRWFGQTPMIGGDKCEVFPLSRQGWTDCRLNVYRNKGQGVIGL